MIRNTAMAVCVRGVIMLALGMALLLSACGGEDTPEQRVHNMIDAVEQAAEKRSLDSVSDHIADSYQDEWHADRRSVLRSLLAYFHRHQNIHLLTQVRDISFNGDESRANVTVLVGMAGTPVESPQALLTLNADLYRFDVELVLEGDDYLLATAAWRQATAEDFGL